MSKKYKKHSVEDRIKYMKMLEDGYSIQSISKQYGINCNLLSVLWIKYQKDGLSALAKKQYTITDGTYRESIIRDIEDNCLSLSEAAIKYNVCTSRINTWIKLVREEGYGALYEIKKRGRPPKDTNMGRPRKKKPEEMTELEQLRYENERLRAEVALLKKVRALVEEREARLRATGRKPSKN
jgi:transposase-like protein